MLPVVAIVGRPNVGKSTLFNRLTKTRNAVVTAYAGTTRDRQYGEVNMYDRHFIIIDTGGFADNKEDISNQIRDQSLQAIEDANTILLVIDGKAGVTHEDKLLANQLRKTKKPIFIAVNKTENLDLDK